MIAAWWASLSVIMKVLWGITLAASLIFVIQTVLTFIGADAGGDFDVDAGGALDGDIGDTAADMGSGMNLYTFRNLVNFFLGFGWTTILLQNSVKSTALLIFIALLVGCALVAVVMYMFKWLSTMQQSGNIDVYKAAVGCTGTVYLTIPGERSGEGKVQITINNAVREYAALTDSDTLKTGTPIKVVEVINPSTMLVEELSSLII
jgi:hypothetical protein